MSSLLTRLFTGCRSGRTTVRVDGPTLVFANTTVAAATLLGRGAGDREGRARPARRSRTVFAAPLPAGQ